MPSNGCRFFSISIYFFDNFVSLSSTNDNKLCSMNTLHIKMLFFSLRSFLTFDGELVGECRELMQSKKHVDQKSFMKRTDIVCRPISTLLNCHAMNATLDYDGFAHFDVNDTVSYDVYICRNGFLHQNIAICSVGD